MARSDDRRIALVSLAAAWVAAGIAVWNAFPGLPPLDAGDFVTASATLGVPHATGFPVYTEFGALWAWLPVGNLPLRIAWASAFLTGAAVGLCTWFLSRVLQLRSGSLVAGVALIGATLHFDPVALHARVAEVYALNLALLALALASLLAARKDQRWLAITALCAGLGLSNHVIFALWVPLLAIAALFLRGGAPGRWRPTMALVGIGALPGLSYLSLVARAARSPLHNWGDPSTPDRLWKHISGHDIRHGFAAQMSPSWPSFEAHSSELIDQLISGLGLHFFLGALGLVLLFWRAGPRWGLLVTGLLLLEALYATLINPMGLRDAQNAQAIGLLFAGLSGAVLGAAADWITARLSTRRHAAVSGLATGLAIALAVAAFVPGSLAGRSTQLAPGSRADWSAEDLALLQAGFALPRSITVTASDTVTAALLYASVVLDARPDALVVGRHVLSDGRWAAQVREHGPAWWATDEDAAEWQAERGSGAPLVAVLRHAGHRTVYWEETGSGDELPAGLALQHLWPMGYVVPAAEAARSHECTEFPTRSFCTGTDVPWGSAARQESGAAGSNYRGWLARRRAYRGARLLGDQDPQGAVQEFARAAELAPRVSTWWTGLAISLARSGALDEAIFAQEQAVLLDPLSRRALQNLIEFHEARGDSAKAAVVRERLGRLD